MKILILDGDSNSGRAVLQSLGPRGYRCWLAATQTRSSAFASRYVRGRAAYPNPLHDKAKFLDWLIAFQAHERFDLIIPSTEITLVPLQEMRDSVELGSTLSLPPAPSLLKALDKEASRRLAEELGMMSPSTWLIEKESVDARATHLPISARFPLVVKPRHSKAWLGNQGTALHVRLVHGPEQLEETLAALLPVTDIQVQEWVPGHGLGIEVLAEHGRVVRSFAHERLHEYPITGGASTYRRAIPPPEPLLEKSKRFIEALQWHGVAMMEFRIDSQAHRSWFMEINPRFWGSLPLPIFAGVDFPAAFVELATGVVTPSARPYRMVHARNFSSDLRWLRSRIAQLRAEPNGKRQLLAILLEWLRPLTGREIWDGASWKDPGPILHEVLSVAGSGLRSPLAKFRHESRRKRAHVHSVRPLQHLPCTRILVACYGNICRSPYIARRLKQGLDSGDWSIRSTGFHSTEQRAVPALYERLAASRGVDVADHRSRRMTIDDVSWADLIVVVDWDTFSRVRRLAKAAVKKIVWLGTFDESASVDIPDPYDMGAQETVMVMKKMDDCSAKLVARLLETREPAGLGVRGQPQSTTIGREASRE